MRMYFCVCSSAGFSFSLQIIFRPQLVATAVMQEGDARPALRLFYSLLRAEVLDFRAYGF